MGDRGVRLGLCGPLRLEGPSGAVADEALRGRQVRRALAVLAWRFGQPVTRDEIADALWDGVLPTSWESSLDGIVSRCRRALGHAGIDGRAAVTLRAGAYTLALPAGSEVDTAVAVDAVAAAEAALADGDVGVASAQSRVALAVVRQSFLPGDDGTWTEARRRELNAARSRALVVAADANPDRAVALLHEALAFEPLAESLHRRLIRAHLRAGDRGEALRAYERCRTTLMEELGVSPSAEIEAVYVDALGNEPGLQRSGIVCLLFTDLVGSTELLDRLGAAQAEAVRRAHFRLLREAVQSTGGQEVKNLGDGLMVVFGSVSDAVRAAIAIERAVARHNRRPVAESLAVRVGLHVGEPIQDEDDYFGLPVHIAKRLCDRAAGGQIIASDVVRELAGPAARSWKSMGSLELRGLAEPVLAHEVTWDLPSERPLPLPAALERRRATFVGRGDALAEMGRWWDAALESNLVVGAVTGEPGIGKSSVLAEFAAAAHRFGASVVFGRCLPDAVVAYQPFIEALRVACAAWTVEELRAHAGKSIADLADLIPVVADRLPIPPRPVALDSDTRRWRLFEAVADLLISAATTSPLVVIIDDVHWADRGTLDLIDHLLDNAASTRILVLGAYREAELARTRPLATALGRWRGHERVHTLSLPGLTVEDVATLIPSERPENDPAVTALARRLAAVTGGNPFFVDEIVRHLSDLGIGIVEAAGERLRIPESVKEVIGHRLGRLSPSANATLTAAAVIGHDFDLDVLAIVTGHDEATLLDQLDEGLHAGVVVEVRGTVDRYSFAHALLREVLYGELSASRRVRAHRRVGEALEAMRSTDPPLADLAYHFNEGIEGGDTARALEYARLAGDAAMVQAAYHEAAAFYERALAALRHDGSPGAREEGELLLALGSAYYDAGDTRAQETLLAAGDRARSLGDGDLLARAALAFRWERATWVGRVAAAAIQALLDDALAMVPEQTARHVELLSTSFREWDFEAMRKKGRKLIEQAEAVGDPRVLRIARRAVLNIGWMAMDDEAGQLDRMLKEAQAAGESGEAELALLSWTRLWRGDLSGCLGLLAEAEETGETRRSALLRDLRECPLAVRALVTGDLGDAESRLARLADLTHRVRLDNVARGALLHLRWEQGQATAVERALRDVSNVDQGLYPPIHAFHAASLAQLGHHDEARSVIRALLDDPLALDRHTWWPLPGAGLTDAIVELGDPELADPVYPALLRCSGRVMVHGFALWIQGAVDRYLGRLAIVLGRYDDAQRHLDAAMAMHRDWNSPTFSALTRCDQARLAIVRGDDPATVVPMLDDVIAQANAIGMIRLADEARSLSKE